MCDLKQEFQQLKAEYSKNVSERNEIIRRMRENLKQRTSEIVIKGLDGKEHQIESNNVEDLYAIDGALIAQDSAEKITKGGEVMRDAMEQNNKYNPSNPYNEQ